MLRTEFKEKVEAVLNGMQIQAVPVLHEWMSSVMSNGRLSSAQDSELTSLVLDTDAMVRQFINKRITAEQLKTFLREAVNMGNYELVMNHADH